MDRVEFFNSINNIQYPTMIVDFFDHFVALKNVVENYGVISVLESNENTITFSIEFTDTDKKNMVLNTIRSYGKTIEIYGRILNLHVTQQSKSKIKIFIYQ